MKFFLTTVFLLLAHLASAQATAHFTASATIIQPISISTLSNLNFADIDAKEGGEVILTPQGERLVVGSVALADRSMITAASFEVAGEQDWAFSISLPGNQYGLVSGREKMTIKDFTSNLGDSGNLGSGRTTINVGATLVINAHQKPGFYTTPTPLAITVNYN